MADQNLVGELLDVVKKTLEFEKKPLITRADWGKINFKSAEQDLKRIFELLNYLNVLPLEYLTDQAATQIKQKVDNIRPPLEQIDKFSIEEGNAPQNRDSLVKQIHTVADQLYTETALWVPFLAYQKGDVAKNIENLSASVLEAKRIVEEAKNDIQKRMEEIANIIEKAREASAAAGAAVFTKDFDNEATKQSEKAKTWLKAAAGLAVATVLIAVLTFFWTYTGLDTGQLWQKIVSKVVVLSILGTATIWCGKIYKALMHQSVINRHRALSLQTFQAFVVATADPQTKDAVLLEATRSIFAIGVTGYVDSGSTSTDSEARIIEIVKSVLPKK